MGGGSSMSGLGDLISGAGESFSHLISGQGKQKATKQARTGWEAAMGITEEGMDKSEKALGDSYSSQEQMLQPYIKSGQTGLNQYQQSVLGYNPGQFNSGVNFDTSVTDPGYSLNGLNRFDFDASQVGQTDSYNFRLNQGMEALDRQIRAGGGKLSGNRLIGLTEYAQGLASTEYENEYQRQFGASQDLYSRQIGENQLGYSRNMEQQNINYQRQTDAYGRAVNEYDINRQNQLQQIQNYQGLANLGYTASTNLSNARSTYGSNLANLYTGGYGTLANMRGGIGEINAAGKIGYYDSLANSNQAAADGLGAFFGGMYGGNSKISNPGFSATNNSMGYGGGTQGAVTNNPSVNSNMNPYSMQSAGAFGMGSWG